VYINIRGILTLILTVAVLLTTVAFTINFSMLGADISNQMVVLTGHRTRDWSSANSYSMHSAVEDRYSRLYVCMMSADIFVPGSPRTRPSWIVGTRLNNTTIAARRATGGGPRDYGFLRRISTPPSTKATCFSESSACPKGSWWRPSRRPPAPSLWGVTIL
jgi:hypothetical protein